MHCPNCNVDLEGGLIFDTFMAKYNDEAKALEVAANYGATRTEGRWNKVMGISCPHRDRIVEWQCPDCHHRWPRT